jgi:hypothetical protein
VGDEKRVGFLELLRKTHIECDPDFLKENVRVLSQALTQIEAAQHISIACYERSAKCTGGNSSGGV